MSEELIVRHCAPTLANLKTGSLFVCPITDRPSFFSSLRSLNELLVPKGLRALPLRIRERSALIEVGAQTNTYAEAKAAMVPLADLLDQVLTGE